MCECSQSPGEYQETKLTVSKKNSKHGATSTHDVHNILLSFDFGVSLSFVCNLMIAGTVCATVSREVCTAGIISEVLLGGKLAKNMS